MKLPYADKAVVPERKLRDYLLSDAHPVGRFKARFFAAVGFRMGNLKEFQEALLEIGKSGEVLEEHETPYGTKYMVPGVLTGSRSCSAEVITVWFIPTDGAAPRLVTVYPR